MKISKTKNVQKIMITGNEEIVEEYSYLGCTFDENARCIAEIAFWKNKQIFRRDLAIDMKGRILDCYIRSVLLYESETWTMTKRNNK